MWFAVGLGNPGARYQDTRHNLGARAVEALAERHDVKLKRHPSGCFVGEARWSGHKLVLARPLSFMNESGRPTRQLLRWYKAPLERLIVIHDELDIPFGEVRVKWGGGTAGHNGLNSVATHLGAREFARVRVGISRPRGGHQDPADYVLSPFGSADRKQLPSVIDRACEAVERVVESGVERAMNEINTG